MPTINLENCIKCMLCVNDCPSDAIDIEQGTINDNCIHCGHCVAICPESTVFPDEDVIKKLNPNTVLPGDFQNLSARIRTCRSYMKKEVDEGMLYLLLENMKHYPSASNARPVEISIIKAKEEIQKLNDSTARNLINTIRIFTSPLLMPILQLLAPKLDLRRLNNYKKQFIARQVPGSSLVCHHAPVVLLFHARVTKYSMAAADANIWATYTSIYANTLGLGTCFNGFIVSAMSRSKAMRKEFRIPDGHQVYASLLVGHPKVKYINEAGRAKPKADLI
ncbi:nitroreductase family protein [Candidatus Gracilibacteria bacterium]|nr:nitroreductase family protein [Candidatus Gracilibacteria bacterium]